MVTEDMLVPVLPYTPEKSNHLVEKLGVLRSKRELSMDKVRVCVQWFLLPCGKWNIKDQVLSFL